MVGPDVVVVDVVEEDVVAEDVVVEDVVVVIINEYVNQRQTMADLAFVVDMVDVVAEEAASEDKAAHVVVGMAVMDVEVMQVGASSVPTSHKNKHLRL